MVAVVAAAATAELPTEVVLLVGVSLIWPGLGACRPAPLHHMAAAAQNQKCAMEHCAMEQCAYRRVELSMLVFARV